MNLVAYVISLLGLSAALIEALFLFKAKSEPILFCIKVCPLYCHPRSKRDVAHLPHQYYFDADVELWSHTHADAEEEVDWPAVMPAEYSPYFFCKPHPTTTAKPMPTTTEEPSFICQLCKDKCKYPK